MDQTLQGRVRFGDFELDPRAGELHGNGNSVILQEQQLKVLLMLIGREGEIATREEIKKKLWPNDTVVEFDHGINSTIRKLRTAFGDSAEKPRYIETVARRGYRLLVPVEWASDADSSSEEPSAGSGESSGPNSDTETLLPKASLKVGRLTGKVVSHYRVLEVIGGGGMGLVYRAEDLKLGRAVALKFLPEEVGDDPRARERFQREAKAVSALDHPNICPIHEFDEYEGHPFIVMQLLQGKSLRDHIAEGDYRLNQPEGLEIAIQIASGLEAAHEKGIIHRDIKPANIFITEKNVAKILDFGVAKIIEVSEEKPHPGKESRNGAPEDKKGRGFSRAVAASLQEVGGNQFQWELIPAPSLNKAANGTAEGVPLQNSDVNGAPEGAPLRIQRESTLTRTGMKLGTAGYMSPEQIRGEPLDARTDIFSFGLVLYEMATGERAFTGETEAVLHDAIQHCEPRPLHELAPRTSPNVEEITNRCLQKDRDARFQTVAELRLTLQSAQNYSPAGPKQAGNSEKARGSRRKSWILVSSVAFLVLATAAGIVYRQVFPHPKLTNNDTIVLADIDNKTGDPAFDGSLRMPLETALEQTPFINLLSQAKVRGVLKTAVHSGRIPVKYEMAKDACIKTNSAAVLSGSIADAGNQYQIELKCVQCITGEILARVQRTAKERNLVVKELGRAAVQLRRQLGEPERTLDEFNQPIEVATSSSPDALKSLDEARLLQQKNALPEAIDAALRAIALDPLFAKARVELGLCYEHRGQITLSQEYFASARPLLQRETKRARSFDEGLIQILAEADLEGALRTYTEMSRSLSNDPPRHNNLAHVLFHLGMYEQAVAEAKESLRLNPNTGPDPYSNLMGAYTGLGNLKEAEAVLRETTSRGVDGENLRINGYMLAFLMGDRTGMQEQLQWARNDSQSDGLLFSIAMDTEFYFGRAKEANRQAERASQLASRAGHFAAVGKAQQAEREAEIGDWIGARKSAATALNSTTDPLVKAEAALALARSGERETAQRLAEQASADMPINKALREYDLACVQAALELNRGRPDAAVTALESAAKHELGMMPLVAGNLYPVYLRGIAYLAAHKAGEASAEFRKIIDHPTIVQNLVWGALARLQLARAYVMMGDKEAARTSYQDFLTLWKDADPDIPIYRQAKAEYAKLNGGKSPSGARR
jgi:serine/threonine protein kinase/tetratricopeptide (TPR) repeat protein